MSTERQSGAQVVEEASVPRESYSDVESEPRRRFNPMVLGGIVVLLLAIGIGWYFYSSRYEDTDDAQVDGHLTPVSARVDGTIQAVSVDDNQSVHSGTVLVVLDPRDYQVSVDQAKAQYDQATAQVNAANPNLPITRINTRTDLVAQAAEVASAEAALAGSQHDLETATARLKESQALNERDRADFQRYQSLYEKNEVSRSSFDQYKAAASAQEQTVAASEAAVASARKTVEQRKAQLTQQRTRLDKEQTSAPLQVAIRQADIKSQRANAEGAQALYEKARLNLGYCQIVAPVSGVVTQRSAEIGAHISAGQQLLMVVQTDDLWVTANFKETQLAHMRPGQRARIYVDALHDTFDGTVDSMPGVTGARTSVLPPENATGNYVKVVQRLPVRIRFDRGQNDLDKLRPGMSVEPKVRVN
jgi:membrane fusion protein (multidrug efflux system)